MEVDNELFANEVCLLYGCMYRLFVSANHRLPSGAQRRGAIPGRTAQFNRKAAIILLGCRVRNTLLINVSRSCPAAGSQKQNIFPCFDVLDLYSVLHVQGLGTRLRSLQ